MPMSNNFLKNFPGDLLIETGTYLGDGVVQALNAGYKSIISIELSRQFYIDAQNKFKEYPNIKIVNNRAHEALFDILAPIKEEQVVFWLDAHYSACGTAGEDDPQPLLKELSIIEKWKHTFDVKSPVILIDDMRTFSYQSCGFSEKEIIQSLKRIDENYNFDRKDGFQEHTQIVFTQDILVATPKNYLI